MFGRGDELLPTVTDKLRRLTTAVRVHPLWTALTESSGQVGHDRARTSTTLVPSDSSQVPEYTRSGLLSPNRPGRWGTIGPGRRPLRFRVIPVRFLRTGNDCATTQTEIGSQPAPRPVVTRDQLAAETAGNRRPACARPDVLAERRWPTAVPQTKKRPNLIKCQSFSMYSTSRHGRNEGDICYLVWMVPRT